MKKIDLNSLKILNLMERKGLTFIHDGLSLEYSKGKFVVLEDIEKKNMNLPELEFPKSIWILLKKGFNKLTMSEKYQSQKRK